MTELPATGVTTTSSTTPPNQTKLVLRDVLRGANGYDEISVEQQWGIELGDAGGTKMGRIAAFLVLRKQGLSDTDAKRSAMDLTLGEIDDMFIDEDAQDDNAKALAAAAGGDVDAYMAAQGALPEA